VPRKPRLLILITLAEAGGAQTSVALLLPALAGRFDVTLAAHGSGPLRDAARAAGVPFVHLDHVRRSIRPWRDALALVELLRLCRRIRPDIVHAHSSKAGALGRVAAALAGVPIRVFTVHGWSFAAYEGVAGRLYLGVERLLRRLTTTAVCVSHAARELGVAARACSPGRTVVIHNAVEVSSFARGRDRNEPPHIISVGRFAFPKDFSTLVEALATIEEPFRSSFVGAGPAEAEVAAALRAHGLSSRVELLGNRLDVPDLLAEADVFVLSSRSEGLPISILEAMAAGLPVVATDVGGVPEAVVDRHTGLLVHLADPDALATALAALVRDPELRRRLGAQGRQRAEQLFDVPRFRAGHIALYRRELVRAGLPEPDLELGRPGRRVLSVAAEPGE
jgi:glycosyltransferase involved in cell wall biosynthesis